MEKTILHKFTVFVYGINDRQEDGNLLDILGAIETTRDEFIIKGFHDKSTKIEHIFDNHPLNNSDAKREQFERHLDYEYQKLIEEKELAEKKLNAYKEKIGLAQTR